MTRAFEGTVMSNNSPLTTTAATELRNTAGVREMFLRWANSGSSVVVLLLSSCCSVVLGIQLIPDRCFKFWDFMAQVIGF